VKCSYKLHGVRLQTMLSNLTQFTSLCLQTPITNLLTCSVMHPCDHQPAKAAISLQSALHPAARRGRVKKWHNRQKGMFIFLRWFSYE